MKIGNYNVFITRLKYLGPRKSGFTLWEEIKYHNVGLPLAIIPHWEELHKWQIVFLIWTWDIYINEAW